MASYRLINEIFCTVIERKVVGGIFCDLQKAFDRVNHNILLTKLQFYGVTGTILKLIKSYLEGRYQKMILDNYFPDSNSDWREIRHRVPHGSILGLLLFLLYIHDLPKIVNDSTEIVLYADDTSIIITSLNQTNFTNSANKILQDINKWLTANLLSLNADKTQYVQFVTKTSSLIDLHVMYKNKEIANTCNTKFLRLTFDNTFSWKNNIDTIVPKLSSDCFTVRAVKLFSSKESLLSLQNELWISIWDNSNRDNTVFNCKKELLELWWGLKIGIHVENISEN
jgi:hypothetical protein